MYKILAKVGFASKIIHYLPSCHSTNEKASQLSGDEGTIIITDDQTNGKGQRGNSWESAPYKNLTFSLVLKPIFLPIQEQFKLTQVISLGIANAVQTFVSKTVKVKWPNDIYVDNKKIGGVLIQNNVKGQQIEYSIIGVGLNVNQIKFETPNAVSLSNLLGRPLVLNTVLNEVLASIYEHYSFLKNGNSTILEQEYLKILYQRNEWKKYKAAEEEFAGKIIGIDPLGRLLIETETAVKCFQNQEITFLND